MSSDAHENARLAERLEEFQKEIRQIKQIGIAVVAVLVGFILVYRLERYRVVSAQEFVLTDSLGPARAKLAFFPEGPGLEVYAASGEPRVELIGGGDGV